MGASKRRKAIGVTRKGKNTRETKPPVAVAGTADSSINRALQLLLKAFNDAKWAHKAALEFAVELRACEAAGALTVDLRWLISHNYTQHLIEVASRSPKCRKFRATNSLRFDPRSCLVLTPAGVEFAERRVHARVAAATRHREEDKPYWDQQARELWFRGELVKRYAARARWQIEILTNFQLEDWTRRIADPLPYTEKDPKGRLHSVIANMNRSQRVIHFCGDGTGEGICWEPVERA